MIAYGEKKRRDKLHDYDKCSICAKKTIVKKTARQDVRKEIRKELNEMLKIPKILKPMAEEARKYDTVKAFEKGFSTVLDKLHQETPPKGAMGYGTNMLSKYGFDIESFWEVARERS